MSVIYCIVKSNTADFKLHAFCVLLEVWIIFLCIEKTELDKLWALNLPLIYAIIIWASLLNFLHGTSTRNNGDIWVGMGCNRPRLNLIRELLILISLFYFCIMMLERGYILIMLKYESIINLFFQILIYLKLFGE